MKKQYKYLIFDEMEVKTKTRLFSVKNKTSDFLLGYVKWYAPWRRYCFFIRNFTDHIRGEIVFDVNCLDDIKGFINKLMIERRNIVGIKNGK